MKLTYMNGRSRGIQIVIEVAPTLERETAKIPNWCEQTTIP